MEICLSLSDVFVEALVAASAVAPGVGVPAEDGGFLGVGGGEEEGASEGEAAGFNGTEGVPEVEEADVAAGGVEGASAGAFGFEGRGGEEEGVDGDYGEGGGRHGGVRSSGIQRGWCRKRNL